MTDLPPRSTGSAPDDPGAADASTETPRPEAPVYPPPFVVAPVVTNDDELSEALAAQTAMYTGPITIPVLNSDPSFRPDPAALHDDVAPPAAPSEPAAPVLPPVPVPPPPAEPAFVAPDDVAADPEPSAEPVLPPSLADLAPPSASTVSFVAAAPEPAEPVFVAPVSVAPVSVAPVSSSTLADDELSRTVEQEAAAGSTLDAILLLENELRRRDGLPPVDVANEPPLDIDAAFGVTPAPPVVEPPVAEPPIVAAVPVVVAAPPGWTPAPDPEREGATVPESESEPESVSPVPGPEPEAEVAPDSQAWLSAPPPSFVPPALVEPPVPDADGLDPAVLTPPPLSDFPPPITIVDGPDGPVDVSELPPPTGVAAVAVAAVAAPPPEAPSSAPSFDALLVPESVEDPDVEGIDDVDRADLAVAIPVASDGTASVAPAPVALTAATAIAVGTPDGGHPVTDPEPLAIEQAGIEPTPLERRAGHAARMFWLWFAANSSIVTLAIGATLFGLGMSLRQVLVAIVAGVALSALPLGLGTLAGKWSGQPTLVVSRATFGLTGNILPAILAVLGRVLWGGVMLWLLAISVAGVLGGADLDAGVGISVWAVVALIVGVVIAGAVAVFGYGLLYRVQRILGILSGILLVLIIVLTAGDIDIATALETDDGSWTLAIGGIVVVFSVVGLAWAHSSSDLARYQSPGGSGAANMLFASFGVIIPTLGILGWGAVLAASDHELAEGFASSPLVTLLGILPPWAAVPVLAASAFGLVSAAIVTVYSGGLALQSAGLRLPRSLATVLAVVLAGVIGGALLALGADTRDVVRDLATTLAVPVAAWVGIFASEMMIRLRRFHAPSLLAPGGVYPAVRWVNLGALVVISVIGFGFTTAQLAGFGWQGYLLPLVGVGGDDPLAGADVGVLIALVLGLVVPLATGIPTIRRQETSPAEAAPTAASDS